MARYVISGAAAALSEFVGLPVHQYGDCGPDATLMALHALWPQTYWLTPIGLQTIDNNEESAGYAAAGGAQNIEHMHAYLSHLGISHHTWGYDTPDIVDVIHGVLRNYLLQHSNDPVIVEYAAAGAGFPDDERNVQYHFNAFFGEDDETPAPEGFIGGYLRGDGDSRTDSPTGATSPLVLTPWAEIERAQPIAMIQIHAIHGALIDRVVHGPSIAF